MTPSRSDAHDVSVADLVTDLGPLAWYEAVAIVRQVGEQVTSTTPAGGVPPLSDIWLEPTGVLRLGATMSDENPVVSLVSMLGALIPPSAPDQLRQLADASGTEVVRASKEEFLSGLAFFSRPDQQSVLEALYTRARAAQEARERANALHALTDKARQAAPNPSADVPVPRKPMNYRRLAMALGVLTLAAVPIVAAVRIMGRKGGAPTNQARSTDVNTSLAHRLQSTVASAAEAVRGALEATPAPEPGKSKDIVLASPRARTGKRQPASATTTDPTPAATEGEERSEGSTVEAVPTVPAIEAEAEGGGTSPAASAVYTAADAAVTPPKLTRAQMPDVAAGGTSEDRRGVLELLVGEDGQVMSARLVSKAARHQERMMISAAKTWRFTPATRNGEPVRYRLQMPITW